MKMLRRRFINRLCCAATVLLVLVLISLTAQAADTRYLWQSREQFVALEPLSKDSAGTGLSNTHPATTMTQERLTAILESITARTGDGNKPGPLLTRPSVLLLAPHLLQALQQATPGEDITFAIIGLYDSLYGLAKSPKVTTGRVFYTAGQLNIIIGLVQQEVRDRDDRRLFPFTPGSRRAALEGEGEWAILPQPASNGFKQIRKDWITFSDEWQPAVVQAPAATTPVPAAVRPPAQQPAGQGSVTRSAAERLTVLNELKSNGLISEEEFTSKRREILNGL
jgi:hypothetical protein